MFLPYHVDVAMKRVPYANFILIGVTCLIHIGLFLNERTITTKDLSIPWVMWIGSIFLHAGWLHLIGNMWALWVFGNAVCAKVGNLAYPLIYLGFGMAAMASHLVFDGEPALGASGAINGVIGMFVVFYLFNEVSCLWLLEFLWPVYARTVSFSSGWLVLLWFLYDCWGAMQGTGNIGYWAHLGGFFAGFGLASLLLLSGKLPTDRGEHSLYELFSTPT